MMPEVVRELAAGGSVGAATLFEFQFRSSTRRYWDGLRILNAGGHEWEGAANVISVNGLSQVADMSAGVFSFALSGTTPELVSAALESEYEVSERPCAVYIQFITKGPKPLDNPVSIWTGVMDQLSFRTELGRQTLSLSAESRFVRRIRAPHSYMTDTDQQARWPGDKGMVFMPTLKHKVVPWLRG